jgi:hypothetical protein
VKLANNAIFGFSLGAVSTSGFGGIFTAYNNATDVSSITGSDSLVGLPFADQFINIDDSVRDFRISPTTVTKTFTFFKSSLVGAGVDAGSIGSDIFGVTRAGAPRYDIGATEAV